MTSIYISADEKYIVGISTIKLDNPYQLVIFSTRGELLKKRHIASEEAKLTQKEFNLFKKKFQNVLKGYSKRNFYKQVIQRIDQSGMQIRHPHLIKIYQGFLRRY